MKGEQYMNNLYVIDKDFCLENDDVIIMQGMCKGCKYYKGFEIKDGQRCIGYSFLEKKDSNV